MPPIFAIYAALSALILLALTFHVIRLRTRHQIGLGHGGHGALEQAIRAHANFTEYVPLCLLLILGVEVSGWYPLWVVHGLGLLLVAARIAHAMGLIGSAGRSNGRAFGAVGTFTVLGLGALLVLVGSAGAALRVP